MTSTRTAPRSFSVEKQRIETCCFSAAVGVDAVMMMVRMFSIRAAKVGEQSVLSTIAKASKASWGYDKSQIDQWSEDLMVTEESLFEKDTTFLAESKSSGEIAGFFQLSFDNEDSESNASPTAEVEHFWVSPSQMGKGVGRLMLSKAMEVLSEKGNNPTLAIDSDPNAEGFYKACGAVRVGEIPAPIPGDPDRIRPQLVLKVQQQREE